MSKEIIFKEKAKEILKIGIDKLVDAVKITMGPRGRAVIISKEYGSPIVTLDGANILREIDLKDDAERTGSEIVKQASFNTNDSAGDGTTAAALFVQKIIDSGLKALAVGIDPIGLRKGMEFSKNLVLDELKKMSKPVETREDYINVAKISSRDTIIGELIADTIEEIGKNGTITVEESQTVGLSREVVKGFQFDNGYISPAFINNPERMETTLDNPYIFITDQTISSNLEVFPILEQLIKSENKNLVIVAENVEGDALATLIINKFRGIINPVAIRAPFVGSRKKDFLEDLSIITGGVFFSNELGNKIKDASVDKFGRARKIIIKKDKTIIIESGGDKTQIDERIKNLTSQQEELSSPMDKDFVKQRIDKISGGIGIIRFGAYTELEQKEKYHRIEDAVCAVKAAIEEGIVPGGGVALARCSEILRKEMEKYIGDPSFYSGMKIIKEAIISPLKQISENAGKNGEVILNKVLSDENLNYGYDADKDVYGDMLEMGILDPLKVVKVSFSNAVSASEMFLITEVLVYEEKTKEDEKRNKGFGS